MVTPPVRSVDRAQFCGSSKQDLREDGLKSTDDCPAYEKQGILCTVASHPSTATSVYSGFLTPNFQLVMFWSYVAKGKVFEVTDAMADTTRPKVLALENHMDFSCACATWGPSFTSRTVVEREEYVRCWNHIRSEPWRFILLRGTKGIGKSVFIYWLIHKIVEQAGSGAVPSFLLITGDNNNHTDFDYLTMENGTPVVRRVRCGEVAADYVLSDVAYHAGAVTSHWNLNVVGYGAAEEPRYFQEKVDDAKQFGLNLLMNPCTLEDLQAMFGPASKSIANFSYTVFGGSARMAYLLDASVCFANEALFKVVHDELTEYLADSVYATCTDLIAQASLVIANKIEAWAVDQSLFRHTYFTPLDARGNGTHETCFATTFMNILAGVLVGRPKHSLLPHLRGILGGGGGGIGVLHEAHMHKALYKKSRTDGELSLSRLYPPDCQKKVTQTQVDAVIKVRRLGQPSCGEDLEK